MAETKDDCIIDAGDVYILPLVVATCYDCDAPATKTLTVDFREAGQTAYIGDYCDGCVDARADRIRAGLPPEAKS